MLARHLSQLLAVGDNQGITGGIFHNQKHVLIQLMNLLEFLRDKNLQLEEFLRHL